MHYVDSPMECRSGKGYCSGVTEFQKKEGMKNNIGNLPILTSTYVMGAQKNRLNETVLLSTYNEC